MTYFVKYRRSDGAFMGGGSCTPGDLPAQIINRPDLAVIECGDGVMTMASSEDGPPTPVISYGPVKAFLAARVDEEAEAQRQRFITPGSGMAMTYLRKEQEARAFLAGGEAGPMIEAEALATGQSLADLAAAVVQASDLCAIAGAAIEGTRMVAKKTIAASNNLKVMDEAAVIDWAAVTSMITTE